MRSQRCPYLETVGKIVLPSPSHEHRRCLCVGGHPFEPHPILNTGSVNEIHPPELVRWSTTTSDVLGSHSSGGTTGVVLVRHAPIAVLKSAPFLGVVAALLIEHS